MTTMDLLTNDDTCVKTAGLGMASTWNLTGELAYFQGAGTFNTDGYKIEATFYW